MFLEACWRAATDDLIASDKWIKSELSAIKDEEIRTLLKELLIDHTGRPAKVLTRSIFKDIYRTARTTILSSRSEERRGGKDCVSTCRSRWSPYQYKNKKTHKKNQITNT